MPTCGKSCTKATKYSTDYSIDDQENDGEDDAAGNCSSAHRCSSDVVVGITWNIGNQEDGRVVDHSGDKTGREAQPALDGNSACDDASNETDEQADQGIHYPVAEYAKAQGVIHRIVKIRVISLIGRCVDEHDDNIH